MSTKLAASDEDDYRELNSTFPAAGTGFFVTADGNIITNHHVIEKAGEINIILKNEEEYVVKISKILPFYDLALLKIEVKNQHFLKIQAATDLKVGDRVVAIGHPLGLTSTMTEGIVSSIPRVQNKVAYIQTDVPVNPGNSDGPLINDQGRVVGIVTATVLFFEGLSFAHSSLAQRYKWQDESGKWHYTNDPQKVPADVRKQKGLELRQIYEKQEKKQR